MQYSLQLYSSISKISLPFQHPKQELVFVHPLSLSHFYVDFDLNINSIDIITRLLFYISQVVTRSHICRAHGNTYIAASLRSDMYWKLSVKFPLLATILCEENEMKIAAGLKFSACHDLPSKLGN